MISGKANLNLEIATREEISEFISRQNNYTEQLELQCAGIADNLNEVFFIFVPVELMAEMTTLKVNS